MNLPLIGGLVCLSFTGAGALSVKGRRAATPEEAAMARARLHSKVRLQ
jgi:hypothetical protein